jgi:FkbM family methyltransferase
LFSLLAASRVGTQGKIFSFEPDPEVAARLRRNIARNNLSNIAVVEAGVWSEKGAKNFVLAASSSPDRGTGKIAPGGKVGISVGCVTLDGFTKSSPPPDAVKCDVEGAELEVLNGAWTMLRTKRPWILCEMHSAATEQAWRQFLSKLGYTFERVDENHVLAQP